MAIRTEDVYRSLLRRHILPRWGEHGLVDISGIKAAAWAKDLRAGGYSPTTVTAVTPQRAHPWPERISSSRFGQLPGDLMDYTPTEPLLVVEVDADVSFEHDRWRHPTRYRRVRSDLRPMDLT